MGFDDEDFKKAKSTGNSIVVNVLVEILRNLLFKDKVGE